MFFKKKNKQSGYEIKGKNSFVYLVDKNGVETKVTWKINGLEIKIRGNNCIVKLYEPLIVFNTFIEIGNDDAYCEICGNCSLYNVHIRLSYGRKQVCKIGTNCVMYGGDIIMDEDASVYIGNDCLFAAGFEVRESDGHSIYDMSTKELLNRVKNPVVIGDHCWLGSRVSVLKNSNIPSNTIVGQGAICAGKFNEENTVICGNPAKVVKHNVGWNSYSPLDYDKEKIF